MDVYESCWRSVREALDLPVQKILNWTEKKNRGSTDYQYGFTLLQPTWYTAISFGGQKWPIEFRGTDDNSNVQQKRPTTQIDNEKKILEAARKAKEILDSKKKEPEVTGLGLLVGQYR